MSLHEPVPAIDLAPKVSEPFGKELFFSPFRFITWLLWWPQALHDYEQRWVKAPSTRPPALDESTRQNPTSATSERHREWLHLCAVGIVATGILTLVVTVLFTVIVWFETKATIPELLLLGTTALMFSALFGAVGGLAAYARARLLVLSFMVAGFFSAFAANLFIHWRILIVAAKQPAWPIIVGATFFTGWIFGAWLCIYLAYLRAKEQRRSMLYLWAGSVTLAVSMMLLFVLSPWTAKGAGVTFVLAQWAVGTLSAASGALLGFLRVDDALIAMARHAMVSPRPSRWTENAILPVAYVTPLGLPHIRAALETWLKSNCKRGMRNVGEVWAQTRQQRALSNLVQKRLAELQQSDQLIDCIGEIANVSTSWSLLFRHLRSSDGWRPTPVTPTIPMDQAHLAVAAGLYYLEHGYDAAAESAFKRVPSEVTGQQELLEIAATLRQLRSIENIAATPTLPLRPRPKTVQRKATWDAFDELAEVRRLAWLFRQCNAEDAKSWCLNRATAHCTAIYHRFVASATPSHLRGGAPRQGSPMPHAEGEFLTRLLILWRKNLFRWGDQPPEREPMKPISNPFHFTRPVCHTAPATGLVGRDEALNEVKLAWQRESMQTVVVYGQPLIGKSSLVLTSGQNLASSVELVHCSLAHVRPSHDCVSHFMAGLCQAVGERVGIPPPPPQPDARTQDPQMVYRHYLKVASEHLVPKTLVIFVDDFDALERCCSTPQEQEQCLHFLAQLREPAMEIGLVLAMRQPSPWLDAPNVGTLLGASHHIHLDFLGAGGADDERRLQPTAQLLNGRLRASGLRFHDDAVRRVYALTNGHPYLVSLLGHAVVVRFNAGLSGVAIDPLFMSRDVDEVVKSKDCKRILTQFGQAMLIYARRAGSQQPLNTAGTGQTRFSIPTPPLDVRQADVTETILRHLAKRPAWQQAELMKSLLRDMPALSDQQVEVILKRLDAAGVVSEEGGGGSTTWWVTVELFRTWLETSKP